MSRNNLRALALIGAAAFLLRFATAAITERHPIFPAYYYTDARFLNAKSLNGIERLSRGEPYAFSGDLSQRLQVQIQTTLYRLIGVHPFAMKLLNSGLGALGVAALAAAASTAFGPAPALAAAAFYAVWPSNIFYTSQNFKEAPANLLALLVLAALLPLLDERSLRRSWPALAAAGLTCLLGVSFFRTYVMLTLSIAFAAAFLGACAARRAASPRLALGLVAALAAPLLFLPISRYMTTRWLAATLNDDQQLLQAAMNDDPRNQPQLLPTTYDFTSEHAYKPTSPRGLTEFRIIRQEADRIRARSISGREIGTQIFPDARFETWGDVLAFMPKSAFYVLFMPLPGLYPMDGKLGRWAASMENVALLILAGLAVVGAIRGPRTPERAVFLLVFIGMTAGSSLLEFDLGSAGRHKLLYLPMLFPFAVEEILRLLGRKEPA